MTALDSGTDNLVADMAERLFRDHLKPAAGDGVIAGKLWPAIEAAELVRAWVPEQLGGAGLPASAVLDLAVLAGRFALPVPLVESILAHRLLSLTGIRGKPGRATIAPVREPDALALSASGALNGECRGIPHGGAVDWFAVVAANEAGGHSVCAVDARDCDIESLPSLAGEPAARVRFNNVLPAETADLPAGLSGWLMFAGASLRSAQMTGALQAMLELTVNYSQERSAFGRPIGKFQAIQHSIAMFAGHVAAASAVSACTAKVLDGSPVVAGDGLLPVAAAKIRCGEAANRGVAIAHQVFGAMGFTAECNLHRFSHRLWDWRDDFGSEAHWSLRLGTEVSRLDQMTLWPFISGGGEAPSVAASTGFDG